MRYATTITLTLALLCLAGPARALDLLPNGKFDDSIADWSGIGKYGSRTWDPSLDASGSDLSGSAKLVHTQTGGGTSLDIIHCFSGPEVQPGAAFFAGAKLRFATGEAVVGTGYVYIQFYPDTECKAGSLDEFEIQGVDTDAVPRGTWSEVKVGSSTSGVVVPAGAVAARLGISVFKTKNTGEPLAKLTMNVDDAFFAPIGTPLCDDMPATIAGTKDSDFINGTEGSDVIVGRGSIDWIDGKGGNDRLCGGPGADVLYGGTGDDRLFGEGGGDELYGADGDDLLRGDGGNDELYGGDGKDRLLGGSGSDLCNGEDGPAGPLRNCEKVPVD
jgi:hypothetical protein